MAASNSRAVAQEVVAAPHYPGRPFTSHVLTRQRGQSALVGIPQTEKEAKYVKCTLEENYPLQIIHKFYYSITHAVNVVHLLLMNSLSRTNLQICG